MISVMTSQPAALLDKIKAAIDKNTVRTWSCDDEGDFTHTADQWNQLAWLTPTIESSSLLFNIIPPINKHITKQIYAIYHGRFAEMLLVHFDEIIDTKIEITSLPQGKDLIESF